MNAKIISLFLLLTTPAFASTSGPSNVHYPSAKVVEGTAVGQLARWDGEGWVAIPELVYDSTTETLRIDDLIVDRTNVVATANATVSNSNTTEVLYNFPIDADSVREGNLLKFHASGVVSNNSASDDLTFYVYIGSQQIEAFNPAIGNVTNAPWSYDNYLIIRDATASGKCYSDTDLVISDHEEILHELKTADFTQAQDLELRVKWDNAKVDNIITLMGAFKEVKH